MKTKSTEELIAAVIADLESQNWSDHPLTFEQKDLVTMAVKATLYQLEQEGNL